MVFRCVLLVSLYLTCTAFKEFFSFYTRAYLYIVTLLLDT